MQTHRIHWAMPILATVLITGCAPKQWTATKIKTIDGFNIPESVAISPDGGALYVSNIVAAKEGEGNDRFWADDATGFISKLKPDGSIEQLKWRDSTKKLPLGSPKGMCLHGGDLWVTDNARMVRYALDGGKPGERITVVGAQKLNDMATDGAAMYASDTATGNVYRNGPGGPRVIKGPEAVNGITFANGRMYAVSWGKHDLYELDPTGKDGPRAFGLAPHFVNLDGIEVLDDGTFLVSDFNGHKVSAIAPDGKTVHTLIQTKTPADIGLDRRNMLLYVPLFKHDKVEVYKLEMK